MRQNQQSMMLEVLDDASMEIVVHASYYREQSPDSNLATRWDQDVMEAITSLLSVPERGALCPFRSQGLRGMRRVPVPGFPNHFVFYLFVVATRTVRVVHVLHGARDLAAFFDQ